MRLLDVLMRWLSGFKVGTQILGAFLLVIGMTAGIGGFSIFQISKVNAASDDLNEKWMPSLMHTTTMRSALVDLRELQVKHVTAADTGYMDEYEEKMKALFKSVDQHHAAFSKMVNDDTTRSLEQAFAKAWKAYVDTNSKVVSLGRANKRDDAKDISDGGGKSTADDAILALDKLTESSFQGGNASAAFADNVYKTSKVATAVLFGLVMFIAITLALLISRGVVRQLGAEPKYATEITKKIAAGDLAVHVRLNAGDRHSLLYEIENMRGSFASIVGKVREGSASVSTASSEIAQGNNDLSARTEQQASALQETVASMEQLDSTVKQNADSARQANQLAMNASHVAVNGGEVVARVVDTMKGINESSRKIADIISVIDGIAFQTNILALNAAVEAARAGEQGRGFAVVASEVRSLAGRSAEAAKEIKGLINASVERVEAGSALVDQAGVTMTEVVASIRRVTDIMGEISAASLEQASGVARIGDSVNQMDQATQQNAALVEEMAAAASSLKGQAQDLVQIVDAFHLNPT